MFSNNDFKYVPTCSDCRYANEYIPGWIYPHGDPRCSRHHRNITPGTYACKDFQGVGMKTLVKFKQEYYDRIRDGVKTQTMRIAAKRLDVNVDEFCIAVFPDGNELLLKITDVGYKAFKSINDDDARREGFDDVDDLKNTLLTIYSDYWLDEYSRVYFYRFECLGRRSGL